MKNIKSFLLLIMLLNIVSFSQTQEKIPWSSLADSPWPVLRGDVQGTKRSINVGPKTPNIIWKKTYPTGIVNGPVLDENGRLYFGSRTAPFSATENNFYCIDSEGEEFWRYPTPTFLATDTAPLISKDGTIYFASQNTHFYALNPDGTLKWNYNSENRFFSRNLISDKEGNIYAGNIDSLFCFTPEGTVKFKKFIEPYFSSPTVFSPSGDRFYLFNNFYKDDIYTDYLLAIDLEGETIWKKKFADLVGDSFLVDNSGKIYVMGKELEDSTKYRGIICLDEDGSTIWKSNFYESDNQGSPTMDKYGNIIYPIYNGLASIDYDGNPRWVFEVEIDSSYIHPIEGFIHSLICDDEGTVFAGSTLGNFFYAISSEGELLWKIPLFGQFSDAPAVITEDGTLYIGLSYGFGGIPVVDNLIAIKDNPNSIKEEELPSEYKLEQNYPNPFNPSTTIKFSLPERSEVKLSIYNLLGQEIEVLFQGEKEAGSYEYVFENKSLSTGVYFYVLESKQVRLSRKMLLIK